MIKIRNWDEPMALKQALDSQAYGQGTFEARTLGEFVETFVWAPQPNFYARGEPREYDTPWLPSIWRTDHAFTDHTPVTGAGGLYTQGELDALKQCQADLRSGVIDDSYFRTFFQKIDDDISIESVDLLHWTALAQHYNQGQRYPTRLLDVTIDAFAALFFAVSSAHDEDGFVAWITIGGHSNDLSHLPDTKTAGVFLDVLSIKANDGGPDYRPGDDTLNYIRPPLPNRRTEAQHGAFVWARGLDQSYLRSGFVIRIPADDKAELLTALKRLNYDDDRLFPI